MVEKVENLEKELSILMEDDELSTLMTEEEHESPKVYPKKLISFIDKLLNVFDDDEIKQKLNEIWGKWKDDNKEKIK